MNDGIRALNILISHIETEFGSDDYYECKNAKEAIEDELCVLNILRNHADWNGSLRHVLEMYEFWERNGNDITLKLLENHDFPFSVDEFETIVRWLRRRGRAGMKLKRKTLLYNIDRLNKAYRYDFEGHHGLAERLRKLAKRELGNAFNDVVKSIQDNPNYSFGEEYKTVCDELRKMGYEMV